METLLPLVRMAAVLIAAIMLGNWFLSEVKSARARRLPWYTPYFTPPGIAILLIAIGLPLIIWYWRRG